MTTKKNSSKGNTGSIRDKVKAICANVGLNLSDLVRRHNNSVIKAVDGEFEYGTSKGEYYQRGRKEFTTHEAYICGNRDLLAARTDKVLASLRVWRDEGEITKAQEALIVKHLKALGKIV